MNFEDLPVWFKKQTINFNDLEKENFIKNFCEEPSLHLVFKNQNYKSIFKRKYIQHLKSGFLINKKRLKIYINIKMEIGGFKIIHPLSFK